jgi:hypothetical protein
MNRINGIVIMECPDCGVKIHFDNLKGQGRTCVCKCGVRRKLEGDVFRSLGVVKRPAGTVEP